MERVVLLLFCCSSIQCYPISVLVISAIFQISISPSQLQLVLCPPTAFHNHKISLSQIFVSHLMFTTSHAHSSSRPSVEMCSLVWPFHHDFTISPHRIATVFLHSGFLLYPLVISGIQQLHLLQCIALSIPFSRDILFLHSV